MSWEQTRAVCVQCGTAYTAKRMADESIIIPTTDNRCQCGAKAFETVDNAEVREKP